MVYETDGFTQPAAATGFKITDHPGELFLIWPISLQEGILTDYGKADAIQARVVLLSGTEAGEPEEYDNTLIFPSVLVSTLRASLGTGKPVLARLGQGTAKPGKNAPWLFQPFTEDDAKIAQAYLNNQWSAPAPAEATNGAPAQSAPAQSAPAAPASNVPADKAQLAHSMVNAGVDLAQIRLVTQLNDDQLTAIGVLQ